MAQRPINIGVGKEGLEPPHQVSGVITSIVSGEGLDGASVFIERQQIGTSTDKEGNYNLELYEGTYLIQVTSIGYVSEQKRINVIGPGKVNFSLEENITELDEIIIQTADADQNVTGKEIGKNVINVESIKSLPPLAGEVDVLRSLTLLPGVSTQGEVSGGFNVRGGGIDQNLILLGGATLYNPTHLFGFFTGFNSSVVRDVTLYKGSVPANYGGRASSVVDVSYKKGNFGQWEGDASLGISASKFSLRGPVVKEKLAIMTAGRWSYPNWILRQTEDPAIANSTASFFDTNLVINYILNERNDLEYSFYVSGDNFQFADNIANEWQNLAQVLRWNSSLSQLVTLQVSMVQNRYTSHLIDDTPFNSFDIETNIHHYELNAGVEINPNSKHILKAGVQFKLLENNLGQLTPGPNSAVQPVSVDPENALESGVYFHHDWQLSERLGLSYGLRYSNFRYLGPSTINIYEQGTERSVLNVIGTSEYDKETIVSYGGIEPRASLSYLLNQDVSIKAGYNRIYQYIHLITNTTTVAPTDTWKLSDPFLKPQIGSQYSLGVFKNLQNNRYEISIEGYYKDLQNLVEYKDGADLFLNESLETELISGEGRTYGVETYFKKTRGRLNGWVSYTYARSLRKIDGDFQNEIINSGDYFPANFDTPHNLSTVANYKLGSNTTLSGVFTVSSGRPFTLPRGKFEYNLAELAFYADRNNERGPTHHRLDVSLRFRFPSTHKIWDGHWTLGVYNLYGRKNPFSVFFQDLPDQPAQAYKLAVVGVPFPSISYEVTF